MDVRRSLPPGKGISSFVVRRWSVIVLGLVLSLWGCDEGSSGRSVPALPATQPAPAPHPPVVSAPPPPAKPKLDAAALLFPHRPGDTWEMRATGGGETHTLNFAVLSAPAEAEAKSFVMETRSDGKIVSRDTYRTDQKGVYYVSSNLPYTTRLEPPQPLLQLPLRSGSAWSWKGMYRSTTGDVPAVATFNLTGPDLTETPAGSFQAYKIEQRVTYKLPSGERISTTAEWLAPRVGLIKQTTDDPDRQGEAVLTSYKVSAPDAPR